MSPRETANKYIPGLTLLLTVLCFVYTSYKTDTQAIEVQIKEKADIKYVDKEIESAKKEMDAKRDADYREFRTDIKYIREGIDELKKKGK